MIREDFEEGIDQPEREPRSKEAVKLGLAPRKEEKRRAPAALKLPLEKLLDKLRTHNSEALKRLESGGSIDFSIQVLPDGKGLAMVLLAPPAQWPEDLQTSAQGRITMARKGKMLGRDRGEIQVAVTGIGVTEKQVTDLLTFTKKKKTVTVSQWSIQQEGHSYRVYEDPDGDLYVQPSAGQVRYVLDGQGSTVKREGAQFTQGSLRGVGGGRLRLGHPTAVGSTARVGPEEKKRGLAVATGTESATAPLTVSAAEPVEREFAETVGRLLDQVAKVRTAVGELADETEEEVSLEVMVYQPRVEELRAALRHRPLTLGEREADSAKWAKELIQTWRGPVAQLMEAAHSPDWETLTQCELAYDEAVKTYRLGVNGRESPAARQIQARFTTAVAELRTWQSKRGRVRMIADLLQEASVTLKEYQDAGPLETKATGTLRPELVIVAHGDYQTGEQETFVPTGCTIHTLTERDSPALSGLRTAAVVDDLTPVREYHAESAIPNFKLNALGSGDIKGMNEFFEATSRPIRRRVIAVGGTPVTAKASAPPGAGPGPTTLKDGIRMCEGTPTTCAPAAGVHNCTGLLGQLSGTVILTSCTAPAPTGRRGTWEQKNISPRTATDPGTGEITVVGGMEPWVADQIRAHPQVGSTLAVAKHWMQVFQRGASKGDGRTWRLLSEERRRDLAVAQPIDELLNRQDNIWIKTPGLERPIQREGRPRDRSWPAWRVTTQAEFDALMGTTPPCEIHITDTLGETLAISRSTPHRIFVSGTRGAAIVSVSGGTVEAESAATIAAVSGGRVNARDRVTVTTVSGTSTIVEADGEARIGTVSGGSVTARGKATVETVTGGWVTAHGPTTVTTVRGGIVTAKGLGTGPPTIITTVSGGGVTIGGSAKVDTVNNGGTVNAEGTATVRIVNTGGTVNADDTSTVTTVNGGTVTARDSATITTLNSGTVYLSDSATVTTNNGGTVNHVS
ncbi:putative adhesin [Streptomyces sp. NPDC048419]|uniref:putative adhesin n=1 Tax=Streptomyces sp. NPDC048419 TaxID=3365547 RepID=UPI003713E895